MSTPEILVESQPTQPDEATQNAMELAYIEESPKGLWPENQNSNFGAHRFAFCQETQDVYDEIVQIALNTFIATADRWLYMWEYQYDLPRTPPGYTLERRRNLVRSRAARGPFTWGLRDFIISVNLQLPTAGPVPSFTPSGIPFDLTVSDDRGIPLYAEEEVTAEMFHVDEDIPNFHYRVGITDGVVYDPATLTRELTRITPAGITFHIGKDFVEKGGAISIASAGGPSA